MAEIVKLIASSASGSGWSSAKNAIDSSDSTKASIEELEDQTRPFTVTFPTISTVTSGTVKAASLIIRAGNSGMFSSISAVSMTVDIAGSSSKRFTQNVGTSATNYTFDITPYINDFNDSSTSTVKITPKNTHILDVTFDIYEVYINLTIESKVNKLHVGDNNPKHIKLGDAEVSKMFLGDILVFGAAPSEEQEDIGPGGEAITKNVTISYTKTNTSAFTGIYSSDVDYILPTNVGKATLNLTLSSAEAASSFSVTITGPKGSATRTANVLLWVATLDITNDVKNTGHPSTITVNGAAPYSVRLTYQPS